MNNIIDFRWNKANYLLGQSGASPMCYPCWCWCSVFIMEVILPLTLLPGGSSANHLSQGLYAHDTAAGKTIDLSLLELLHYEAIKIIEQIFFFLDCMCVFESAKHP